MHYVNDNLDQNITDGSGVDLYYTSSLRANTIGTLTIGSEVNWKSLALVPGTSSITTYFYCYSDCVNVRFLFYILKIESFYIKCLFKYLRSLQTNQPQNEIILFASYLHTYSYGNLFILFNSLC